MGPLMWQGAWAEILCSRERGFCFLGFVMVGGQGKTPREIGILEEGIPLVDLLTVYGGNTEKHSKQMKPHQLNLMSAHHRMAIYADPSMGSTNTFQSKAGFRSIILSIKPSLVPSVTYK